MRPISAAVVCAILAVGTASAALETECTHPTDLSGLTAALLREDTKASNAAARSIEALQKALAGTCEDLAGAEDEVKTLRGVIRSGENLLALARQGEQAALTAYAKEAARKPPPGRGLFGWCAGVGAVVDALPPADSVGNRSPRVSLGAFAGACLRF